MRQPAYAKRLMELRRSGVHPALITVIYGNDWRLPGDQVRVAVKPREALGLYWGCVAGLPVRVLDRATLDANGAHEDPFDEDGNCELFFLLGEIAPFAARLEVVTTHPLTSADARTGPGRALADVLAHVSRSWNREEGRMQWPRWWSEEIDKAHGKTAQRWITEVAQVLAA